MRRLPSSRSNVKPAASSSSSSSRRPTPTVANTERVQIQFQDDDDFLGTDSGDDAIDIGLDHRTRRPAAAAASAGTSSSTAPGRRSSVSKAAAAATSLPKDARARARGETAPARSTTSSSSSSSSRSGSVSNSARRRWQAEEKNEEEEEEEEDDDDAGEEEEQLPRAKKATTAKAPSARRRILSDDDDEEAGGEEGEEKDIFEFYLPSHNGKGRPLSSLTSSTTTTATTTTSSSSSSSSKAARPPSSSAKSTSSISLRSSAQSLRTSSSAPSSQTTSSSSSSSSSSARSKTTASSSRATKPTSSKPSSSSTAAAAAAAAKSRTSASSTSRSTRKPAAAAVKVEIEIDTDDDDDQAEDDGGDADFAKPSATTTTPSSANSGGSKSMWLSPKRAAGKFTQYTRAASAPTTTTTATASSSSSTSARAGSHKRPYAVMSSSSSSSSSTSSASSSKRRAKTAKLSPGAATEGGRLWSDKYDPTSEDDLAVYPKRVAEVRDWLKYALAGRGGRILCLTGPSGGGKTALLKVVARQLNVGITEWINPATCPWTDSDRKLALPYTAPIQEFRAFLQRTERYPSLVTTTTTTTGAGTTADSDLSGNQAKRLILIEDLPFLGHLPALRTFQDLLLHHLRTPGPRFPLVLIISDDSLGNSPLFRLLPQEIMAHPAFRQIKIAGVAPTRAAKVLAKIAGLEGWKGAGKAARGKATGVNTLAKVCGGDLRSAINALQLLSGPGGTLTDQAADSTQRDVPLSLFHALGKVLHNKRGDDGLPENEVEQVIEQAGVEPARFTEFVHENYPGFMADDIDAASAALEYLSDADTLQAAWEAREDTSPMAGALWSRGLMYASRNSLAPGGSHGYRPLFKPRLYAATAGQSSTARAVREVCGAGGGSGALAALAARPALLVTEVFPYTHRIAFLRPTLRPLLTAPYPGGFAWLSEFCSYSRASLAPPQALREDEVAELPALEGDFADADHPVELEEVGEKPPAKEAAAAEEGNAVQAEGGASKRPSQPPLGRPTQGARAPPPQSGGGGGRVGNVGGSLRPPPPRTWGHQHQSAPPSAPSSPIDPVLMEDDITDF